MRCVSFTTACIVLLAASAFADAGASTSYDRRHTSNDVRHGHRGVLRRLKRAAGLDPRDILEAGSENSSASLVKRGYSGRATYYEAGLGACGRTNSGSDFIVAVNPAQWAGGSNCFKTITITVGGKSRTAQITDLCPGCPSGALDLSQGLFTQFADTSAGVFQMSWSFGDGAQPTTTSRTSTTPKSTSTRPSSTTSQSSTRTTSSSTSITSTTSQSSSSQTSSSTSSSATTSSTAPAAGDSGVFDGLSKIMSGMLGLAGAGQSFADGAPPAPAPAASVSKDPSAAQASST
ncbi:hypothetical protein IE81DRAFT_325489 [Ceraceosorus guamensis]|uniref:RlpA-like protein double-psi beta-barrel domain-containing protein n=1 Tax=Ceraceosorus guamensis TaxID=1522189 RepID=A0A316VSL4_9BASI|nr:hypothetical protein IE81DRAFT_325489 [Ceraceosorus guamensis]PWN40492.1 hypothetical protein IE81DRAFT_325489 [Ceraceosorus guamensis]